MALRNHLGSCFFCVNLEIGQLHGNDRSKTIRLSRTSWKILFFSFTLDPLNNGKVGLNYRYKLSAWYKSIIRDLKTFWIYNGLLLLKGHSVYQTLGNRVKESVSNVKPRIRALWPTRYWPATTMQIILDNFDIWMIQWYIDLKWPPWS